MIRRDAATERQVHAADPGASTWLSANAGSGKTRVLTDRVARLLLGGVDPQQILCLTYTKAAASEMQNRLFGRLGTWAMLPEDTLRQTLAELGADGAVTRETLAVARRLFARAIDTPGGLKIQTIHSFCAALLRRFPLESGVSPAFRELDERETRLLREEIVEELAAGNDRPIIDAIARLSSGEDIGPLTAEICRHAAAFTHPGDRGTIWGWFDLAPGFDAGALAETAFDGSERALLETLFPLLLASGPMDQKAGMRLSNVLARMDDTASALAGLEQVLLTGKGAKEPFSAKIGSFPTKALARGAVAPFLEALDALMLRVENARRFRLALDAAERTLALHRFAAEFLPRYSARKAERGLLDFDDLIERAGALLSDRSVAQWVLYRLDGGISHVLVDEAQDTSPGQWKVIESLTQELTAGEGARAGAARSLFVVGDKKQSIYSFQGADLTEFDRMQGRFRTRLTAARIGLQELDLEYSFRSSAAILRLVDTVFSGENSRGLGAPPRHLAFLADQPGRVDLWPAVEKSETEEPGEWDRPVDLTPDHHHTVRLARRIAAEIVRMIAAGTRIPGKNGPRPVHCGDFLVLVQRRSPLFAEIIRACKAAGLAVAGADRLKLGAELAVKDLGALLAFLDTPEDDLALASALRSPIFGWTEADIFDLAARREPRSYLWTALRARRDRHPDTLAMLDDLRSHADFLRPYDLIERILTVHDGRRRLLARLGPEAEDGIDELLSQALQYESGSVPSLTGFLARMQTEDIEVKRQLATAGRTLRVMTVHGSKGLEAPIVILPDTAKSERAPRAELYDIGEGRIAWKTAADESPVEIEAARARMIEAGRDERARLLYVALTRAEKWLIVCAAGETGGPGESWYERVRAGMLEAGAESLDMPDGAGRMLRLSNGDWPEDRPAEEALPLAAPAVPAWTELAAPPAEKAPVALSPSDLGGAKVLPGEAETTDAETAKRRGRLLHRLLEHLPHWPEDARRANADVLLLSEPEGVESTEIEPLFREAALISAAPGLAWLFEGQSLAEVDITACLPELSGRRIHGSIDRLIVEPDRVLAVDYKSNAIIPGEPSKAPEGYLRQMGAYAAALAQIFPGRRIETAILWTRSATLMPLPPDIVGAALRRATIT